MPYEGGRFASVVSFTMLYHVPTPQLQDRFFSEAYRVLRSGGTFAGVDSLPSISMSIFHIRDMLTLVAPTQLLNALLQRDLWIRERTSAQIASVFLRGVRSIQHIK